MSSPLPPRPPLVPNLEFHHFPVFQPVLHGVGHLQSYHFRFHWSGPRHVAIFISMHRKQMQALGFYSCPAFRTVQFEKLVICKFESHLFTLRCWYGWLSAGVFSSANRSPSFTSSCALVLRGVVSFSPSPVITPRSHWFLGVGGFFNKIQRHCLSSCFSTVIMSCNYFWSSSVPCLHMLRKACNAG